MTGMLSALLLRLSEAGAPALLWGRQAAPHFGRAFDRLLARGILIEHAPATEWELCPTCECGLEARPIRKIDGRHIAACPLDRGGDIVLDDDDLRSFRIEPAALVREIAAVSGFGAAPSEVAPGVWHLGMSATRTVFLAISEAALAQPGLIATLRMVERSAPITVIAPTPPASERTRFAEAEILHVDVGACIGEDFVLDHARLEPPHAFAPRLVIGRAARSVMLDGVPKLLSEQAFKLLVLLAEQALKSPAIVENRVIESHLWGSSIHRITSEPREPVRALRDALVGNSADSRAVRSLVENRRNPNGYRLVLTPEEIELKP
ncbi:hypothetical protein GCM10007972_24450 [Iodidimonas muriae]|uniref:OmpR/PhoB-type domain-containing protein n=1 Tax=Iodidimonas muriae TaxID=261467 RepID=A0ABQ2LFN3_9PROT|nr:hypothetical protein [Iodidimonas muriae]GGO15893.1 hypothetical protein GCM10007972_24450 [Iodidimonas muriae]